MQRLEHEAGQLPICGGLEPDRAAVRAGDSAFESAGDDDRHRSLHVDVVRCDDDDRVRLGRCRAATELLERLACRRCELELVVRARLRDRDRPVRADGAEDDRAHRGRTLSSPSMRRGLPGGYELDDDVARIDIDAVHRYLSEESYWAAGRPREVVEDLVRRASRVVGLYYSGLGDRINPVPEAVSHQVGFARVHSDGHTLAYLADVYVLPEHRGDGRGVELVREAVEGGDLARVRWLLHTKDAHTLYERFGFGPPSERVMERSPG